MYLKRARTCLRLVKTRTPFLQYIHINLKKIVKLGNNVSLSTMFLLGAGASHNAGIKGIDSMTNSFLDMLNILVQNYAWEFYEKAGFMSRDSLETDDYAPDAEEIVKTLKEDISKKKDRFDIELLLEALNHLDNKEHILYSMMSYPKKYEKYDKQYKHVKNILIKFIRNQCENISSVNYLYPISAFKPPNTPLDIFTLNYDGTIEKMCKEYNLTYTDGFKEEWNPDHYLDENLQIRLYKLHGSLYWYKTEKGKYIKLPIKNVDVETLTYFMDEKISETLLFPMITKDYSTGPFPWLMEELRKKLRMHELCIVLGYSFRDNYIKQILLDEMQNNTNLWILIVDHNSKEIKDRLCNNNELESRIIIMDDDIEKALSYRILIDREMQLYHARSQESHNINTIISNKTLSVNLWKNVFNTYRKINHIDRIEYIVKYLLENFEGEDYEVPSLQWTVFDLSLLIGMKYYLKNNHAETQYWLNIFRECSYVLDWIFSRGIETDFPFYPAKLPRWVKDANPETYAANFKDFEPMFNSIGKCMKILVGEKEVLSVLDSFFKSLHYYKHIQGVVEQRKEQILAMQNKGLLWYSLCDRLIYIINEKMCESIKT